MTRKVEKRMYAAICTTEPKFPLTTFRLLIFNHVVYSVIIVSNRGHVKNQKIFLSLLFRKLYYLQLFTKVANQYGTLERVVLRGGWGVKVLNAE